MATCLDWTNPQVGQIVYQPFYPQVPGRIIEVLGPTREGGSSKRVRVHWLKPVKVYYAIGGPDKNERVTESVHDALGLNDFTSLVESTERKALNHRMMLEKARKIAG